MAFALLDVPNTYANCYNYAMNFEMIVHEVFHLQSGCTVFAGAIEGCSVPIKECSAELLVDGKAIQTLTINGEFLMNAKHPLGHRAISTTDCVDLTSSSVREHQYSLRSISQPIS